MPFKVEGRLLTDTSYAPFIFLKRIGNNDRSSSLLSRKDVIKRPTSAGRSR